jgi:hypothetical protein
LLFTEQRPLHEHELKQLAPAAKFQRSLLGVQKNEAGRLQIWGILHSGPGWLREIQGGRAIPQNAPPTLVVSVLGAGRLVVTRGRRTIATLTGGRVEGRLFDVFDSRWLPATFTRIAQELWDRYSDERLSAEVPWAELDLDVVRMIGQHFVRRILTTVRLAHHGGTLLLVPPELANNPRFTAHLLVKYIFEEEEPRRRFGTLLLRIMREMSVRLGRSHRGQRVGWKEYNAIHDEVLAGLDEAVFELAHFIAALADVDGAVVLDHRFDLIGFGAEIAGDLPDVLHVAHALDLEGDKFVVEPLRSVGTRHRSAYRLCNAFQGVIAAVVSQDGGVRFCTLKNGQVTYWNQLGAVAISH